MSKRRNNLGIEPVTLTAGTVALAAAGAGLFVLLRPKEKQTQQQPINEPCPDAFIQQQVQQAVGGGAGGAAQGATVGGPAGAAAGGAAGIATGAAGLLTNPDCRRKISQKICKEADKAYNKAKKRGRKDLPSPQLWNSWDCQRKTQFAALNFWRVSVFQFVGSAFFGRGGLFGKPANQRQCKRRCDAKIKPRRSPGCDVKHPFSRKKRRACKQRVTEAINDCHGECVKKFPEGDVGSSGATHTLATLQSKKLASRSLGAIDASTMFNRYNVW